MNITNHIELPKVILTTEYELNKQEYEFAGKIIKRGHYTFIFKK